MSRLAIPCAVCSSVDGQHPNLGLIWSRDLGERGARQGDRDGTHDRTPLFGNQQGGVLDSRPAASAALRRSPYRSTLPRCIPVGSARRLRPPRRASRA